MIKFSLQCAQGHAFESWFRNGAACDTQLAARLVACPTCGGLEVRKAVMAPAVTRRDLRPAPARAFAAEGLAPNQAQPPASAEPVLLDDNLRQMQARVRAFHDKLVAQTTDVGTQFPAQARQMHEGEIPQAPIRGQATLDEAKALWDEGIAVLPLPNLPDALN